MKFPCSNRSPATSRPPWPAALRPRPASRRRRPRTAACPAGGTGKAFESGIAILQRDGFTVQTFDQGNNAARARFGLPARCGSCHTARIGGYVVEGHVPAREVRRLLAEKPDAIGIAVPGMPIGSPGMDGPEYGGRRDPCEVLLVLRDGSSRVYASYKS